MDADPESNSGGDPAETDADPSDEAALRSDGGTDETVGERADDADGPFFEAVLASTDAAILACDAAGTVVYANDAVETMLGAGEGTLVGLGITETPLVDADSDTEWAAGIDEPTTFQRTIERDPEGVPVLDGGSAVQLAEGTTESDGADGDVDTADAREVAVEATAKPLDFDGERHVVVTCRDVTERVLYERESNILDAIFESIPIYLYIKDEDGRHVRVSDFNEGAQDYLGKRDIDIWGEDGRDTYEEDMHVIEEGETVIQREQFQPEWNQFFLSSKVPWRGEDGDIKGLIGITNDLSEWKRKEKQLERQNERLRTVASVISHDIRNPLQVAKGRLDMAADEHESDNLDAASDALDRMAELLEELLELVRHGQWVDEPETVSLQSVAEGCWEAATSKASTLEFEMDLNLAADPGRLQQLLENLFRNAVVHGGDDVHVRVGPLDDWSGFYVADDGPGIPEADRDQIFESGYTTSEEGTGFGLAIVQVIAEAHGWHVEVTESEAGGACFEFRGVEWR